MARRLLLVDDDGAVALTLGALLEDEGYAVDVAASCAEARDRLREGPYDAVVLDSRLPDGDGRDLVPAVRASAPGARVVLHSGRGDSPAAGPVDALVVKGSPFALLLRAVCAPG